MAHFLAPITEQLGHLYLDEVSWRPNPNNPNEQRRSRFMLLIVSADSEERYAILGMTRHNGEFGCTCCLIDGEVNEEAANNTRIYPVVNEDRTPNRTDQNIRADAEAAVRTERFVHGIQAFSALQILVVNLRTAQLIDPLHCLWRGNFERVFKNLTSANRQNHILPADLATISRRILKIRTPTKLSRRPRHLEDFSKFVANEEQHTCWFYWLPCAQDFLTADQLHLCSIFAEATFIMNKDCILPDELDRAEQLINEYRILFQILFPREEWTYNTHLIKHSVTCVRDLGPSFVASGFWFESLNRQVVNFLTSPTDRASQVSNRILLGQMVDKYLDTPERFTRGALLELWKIIGKERWEVQPDIAAGLFVQTRDEGEPANLNPQQVEALLEAGINYVNRDLRIMTHEKIWITGVLYQIVNNRRTAYNNSIAYVNAQYRGEIVGFVEITSIVSWQHCNDERSGIFGTRFRTVGPAFETTYMRIVNKLNNLVYIPLTSVITPGVLVESCDRTYISRLPNRWDND